VNPIGLIAENMTEYAEQCGVESFLKRVLLYVVK